MITRLDFIGIPSQDADRACGFYRDTLGLRADEHGDYEQWAGDTWFGIWEPEKMGMPFVAQKGNPWALGCDDVPPPAPSSRLKASSSPATPSTPVSATWPSSRIRTATNLMLHHRYAPDV